MIGYDVSVRPSPGTDCCRERRERERDSVRDGKGVSGVCFAKKLISLETSNGVVPVKIVRCIWLKAENILFILLRLCF